MATKSILKTITLKNKNDVISFSNGLVDSEKAVLKKIHLKKSHTKANKDNLSSFLSAYIK